MFCFNKRKRSSYGALWGDIKGTLSSQTDLEARLTADENYIVIAASTAAWGGISGTLSLQNDLNTRLNGIDAAVSKAATTAEWGQIVGDISLQSDLKALFPVGVAFADLPTSLSIGCTPTKFSQTYPTFAVDTTILKDLNLILKCFLGVEGIVGDGTSLKYTLTFTSLISTSILAFFSYQLKRSGSLISLSFIYNVAYSSPSYDVLIGEITYDISNQTVSAAITDKNVDSFLHVYFNQSGTMTTSVSVSQLPTQLLKIMDAFRFLGV